MTGHQSDGSWFLEEASGTTKAYLRTCLITSGSEDFSFVGNGTRCVSRGPKPEIFDGSNGPG